MSKRIFDPPIPYVDNIQAPFTPHSLIRIEGTTPRTAYRFKINFQCGPSTAPQDDIALQISARVLEGTTALNSLQNGIWGNEQIHSTMPIKRSEKFVIVISCRTNFFKVEINGRHKCKFPFRIPCDKISHLAIDGDVSIIQISYEKASIASAPSASSSRPITPSENKLHDFSVTHSSRSQPRESGFQPLNPGIHPPSNGGGFNDPPAYEEAVHGKQFQPFPNRESHHPSAPSAVVYPVDDSAAYSASAGRYLHDTYPAVGASLNAASSNFQPVKSGQLKKCCLIFWFGLLALIVLTMIIVVIVLITNIKPKKSYTSSYSKSSYDDKKY